MKTKYLLVEDIEELRNRIAGELRRSSSATEVLEADSGESALAKLEQEPDIDLVLLDLTLNTEMYGLELLTRIREFSNVVVIVLTSDLAPERQTEAIERGADGYIDKTRFESTIQLRRHLEVILQRKRSKVGTRSVSDCYSFEGWKLDAAHRQLFNPDGAEVTLSIREFDLLLVFVENPQTILTRQELIDKLRVVGGKDPGAAVTTLLSRLRKKLDKEDRSNPFIQNIYGQGFQFKPVVSPVARP